MAILKNTEVRLPAHLAQFARRIFPVYPDGRIKVHNIVLLATTNSCTTIKKEKGVLLPVSMYRPTERAKYGLCRYIRLHFHLEMGYMVSAYMKAGLSGKSGIADFLKKYEIDTEMYCPDTAYRMFYKKTKKKYAKQ